MPWKLKDTIPPHPTSITDIIDGDLDEVTSLSLTNKGLKALPDDIGRLGNLTALYVSGNFLTDLPPGLADIAGLQYLSLSRNEVKAFPPVLITLRSLKALNLSYTPLESIPAEISRLLALTQLWLDSTKLAELPVSLAELPLVSFGLPVWTDNSRTILGRLKNLRSLALSDMDAAAVDEALVLAGPALTEVTLKDNGLTALPDSLTGRDLTALRLYNQNLTAFPPVRHFSHLQDLTLAACGLQEVPSWIGTLSQLRELFLLGNTIRSLPRELADLGDNLNLNLNHNLLEPPLDALAKQGTPALFAYLRGLPDEEPAEEADPDRVARDLPEQRPAPLSAHIVDGRLLLAPAAPPAEAGQRELDLMHDEVRDWGSQTLTRVSNNHPLIYGMIERYLKLLGNTASEMQVIPLAFTADRLERFLEKYFEEDGRDPLSMEQRGMCEALLGNHGMMLNWTAEWQDYKKKAESTPISAEATQQVHSLLGHLAAALQRDRAAVDPAVPAALTDIAATANPAEPTTPVAVQGAADSLHNTLSPLARAALLFTKDDRAEARKTVVRWATNTALASGVGLAAVAGSFFLNYPADLAALAHLLPTEFSWVKQVIAALRALKGTV